MGHITGKTKLNRTYLKSNMGCLGSSVSESVTFGPPIAPSTLCGEWGNEGPFPDSTSSSLAPTGIN